MCRNNPRGIYVDNRGLFRQNGSGKKALKDRLKGETLGTNELFHNLKSQFVQSMEGYKVKDASKLTNSEMTSSFSNKSESCHESSLPTRNYDGKLK